MVLDEKPDVLILNGDIFDPWKSEWSYILQTISYHWMHDLTGRIPTVYINRNHDYNAPPYVIPSATRAGSYQAGKWLVMHGWEFSMDWGLFGPALFWLSAHWPSLMIPLNRLAIPQHVPASGPHDTRQDWNRTVGRIHDRARAYAQKHQVDLCIGHTHCPTPFDSMILDEGDMEDSFTYARIDTEAELRTL
jgi:UDP-2,3-diacylglucosamine pyrophosphatase LpxH